MVGRFGRRAFRFIARHGGDQPFETVCTVKRQQSRFVSRLYQDAVELRPTGHVLAQITIGFHGHQLPTSGQPFTSLSQVFSGNAFDLVSARQQGIERTVFNQPFGCGLGPHLGHTRHVVNGVTHQGLVIDHQAGGHAKLFCHASHIAFFAVHGVDDGDALIHQLAQIFVAAGDDDLHALLCRHMRQSGNHIVSFHTRHIQQRPAHQFDQPVDGFDLAAQIIWHGRAGRLVVGVNGVSKGGPLGVKHTHRMGGGPVSAQALQHVDHATDRTGGLALRVVAISA